MPLGSCRFPTGVSVVTEIGANIVTLVDVASGELEPVVFDRVVVAPDPAPEITLT